MQQAKSMIVELLRLGRATVGITSALSLIAIACMSSTRTRSSDQASIDSARAVDQAIAALKAANAGNDAGYKVWEFTRDASGAVITLIPIVPEGRLRSGGSATIRVWNNGKTKILVLGI